MFTQNDYQSFANLAVEQTVRNIESEEKTMENNMTIYNRVRKVPADAQKPISAGRLKGMTDINPMWRINALTEVFGAAGFGWYYEVTNREQIQVPTGEIIAHIEIDLYVKMDGEWSKPIHGIGGSMLVANEKSGQHASDEGFKMALTDAISVACKALGFGADVYWQAGRTKYSVVAAEEQPKPKVDIKAVAAYQMPDGRTLGEIYKSGVEGRKWIVDQLNLPDLDSVMRENLEAFVNWMKGAKK